MTDKVMSVFNKSLQSTEELLKLIEDDLKLTDRQHAYHALRSVLMSLRDRLTVDEATDLGAQLPLLVRGIYYEGWRPPATPQKWKRDEFLEVVRERYALDLHNTPEAITRAVWKALNAQVTEGELNQVLTNLPKDLARFLEGTDA